MKKFLIDLIQLSSVRHIVLAGAVVLLAFIIQYMTFNYGERKADLKMTKLLKYSAVFPDSLLTMKQDYRAILVKQRLEDPKAIDAQIYYATLPLPKVVNCKVARIYEQLTDVVLKAHNHLAVAREFMVQSFVCTSTAAVFFILAGVSLAFITKSGFAQANPYFITLLISSIAVGSFFIGLTNIFKQEQNASDNMALYVKYINLDQAIRTKIVTDKYILLHAQTPCDTASSLDATIALIDNDMKELNQIALGFDAQVVKSLTDLKIDTDVGTGN